MDAVEIVRISLRRWFVFLPLLILGVCAGFGLSAGRPSTYTATTSVALIQSSIASSSSTNQNPLNTANLTDNVTNYFGSAQVQNQYLGSVPAGKMSVSVPQYTSLLQVLVSGSDGSAVLTADKNVTDAAIANIQSTQTLVGVPDKWLYKGVVVSPARITAITPPSKLKLIGAFSVVGLLAGFAGAVAYDRFFTRRNSPPGQSAFVPPASGAPRKKTGLSRPGSGRRREQTNAGRSA